ncbi:MAG: hypothetical protein R6U20_07880 [Longimonas sp.]|uniref:hypothetical protein n=1 Tax=Longimonas sp. TaxID=2039626 RepID=UPI0039762F33
MSDSDAPSILQHLNAVYTLACTLVGPDQARTLTTRVFQRAATVPPRDRPANRTLWLMECTLKAYSDHNASEHAEPDLRAHAAQALVQDTLPAAWAACSPRDRTLLAARLGLDLSSEALASLVDLSAEDLETAVRSARSSLRASLRDMLVGPQRMLVDTAFPDAQLDDSIRTFLRESYGTPPSALRKQVAQTVQTERTPSAQTRTQRTARRRRQWLKTGGVIAGLLLLLVLAWSVRTLWPSPSEPESETTDLLTFSVQHVGAEQTLLDTASPDSVQAFWTREQEASLSVPRIDRADLEGLAALPIDADPIPVLRYRDVDARAPLYVFVYSYAQLDRLEPNAKLPRAIRQTLDSEDTFVEQSVGERSVLLWRVRDHVYVAVFAPAARDTRPQRIEP